jgi:phosphoglycolate phosphatase-like HAD superfamily hydrolase
MTRPVLAIDADGVMLDLHHGVSVAWERAFGMPPREKDPHAYWPQDRWDIGPLEGEAAARFRACFDEPFWSALPALPGAIDACTRLHDAGHELVCITALRPHLQEARLRNLRSLGFPIERVIAVGSTEGARSPKADAIELVDPVAFVDDYLPYLRGLPPKVHTALVVRAATGSPNTGEELSLAKSIHRDLADFADHWLSREAR